MKATIQKQILALNASIITTFPTSFKNKIKIDRMKRRKDLLFSIMLTPINELDEDDWAAIDNNWI